MTLLSARSEAIDDGRNMKVAGLHDDSMEAVGTAEWYTRTARESKC